MVSQIVIQGFEEFDKYAKNIDNNGPPVYFYFSGSKLPNGNSWCPDCVEAEPVLKDFINQLKSNVIFAYVDVGDRDYWKDKGCPFRTDNRTRLMVIPTLIKWKGVQRLEGGQCSKQELLQMMFDEEE
ncbi:hypothetical protein ACJJTC_008574 [Scirpophaga incertulas]